ncbi:hypothetical protein P3T37_002142 [Kitasatospora sp. MAA4]|uniref:hypothetical protein n=1 Tax=Kitasatospora sp. MAA4 TaxID=3035093 RepID=UPI002473D457|nr:hypothetical protein [Kitasatospora sp. MAA4]MDH6132756.1 hypothetical protein [Kitasatospora sp. MAA4]
MLATLASRLPVLSAVGKSLRRRFSGSVLRDGSFLSCTGINAVLTMHMTLLSIGIPLWIAGEGRCLARCLLPAAHRGAEAAAPAVGRWAGAGRRWPPGRRTPRWSRPAEYRTPKYRNTAHRNTACRIAELPNTHN